jgi:hypothetical protein
MEQLLQLSVLVLVLPQDSMAQIEAFPRILYQEFPAVIPRQHQQAKPRRILIYISLRETSVLTA